MKPSAKNLRDGGEPKSHRTGSIKIRRFEIPTGLSPKTPVSEGENDANAKANLRLELLNCNVAQACVSVSSSAARKSDRGSVIYYHATVK